MTPKFKILWSFTSEGLEEKVNTFLIDNTIIWDGGNKSGICKLDVKSPKKIDSDVFYCSFFYQPNKQS